MSRPTCAGKDTPVRASSEILMVENVNTHELPSEWISPTPQPLPRSWPTVLDNRIRPERRKINHIRQLEALGCTITLTPAA